MLFDDCFLTMDFTQKNTITRNAESPLVLAELNNNSTTLNIYSVTHNTFSQSICLSSQERKEKQQERGLKQKRHPHAKKGEDALVYVFQYC